MLTWLPGFIFVTPRQKEKETSFLKLASLLWVPQLESGWRISGCARASGDLPSLRVEVPCWGRPLIRQLQALEAAFDGKAWLLAWGPQ